MRERSHQTPEYGVDSHPYSTFPPASRGFTGLTGHSDLHTDMSQVSIKVSYPMQSAAVCLLHPYVCSAAPAGRVEEVNEESIQ